MHNPFTVGEIVADRFRVEKVLGQGGMGVVVAAVDLQLGRQVAIKCMIPATDNQQAVARFVREAKAAAGISSEHVTRVIDIGVLTSGLRYIVMEMLQGMDLQQLLKARGQLPVPEVVDYILQACDAIGEAHSKGIIHRDLKPSNLFLADRPNGVPIVKVLDFGVSKLSETSAEDSGDVSMTGTSTMLGSPRYMSPEQVRCSKNVDGRADIWSLGVIMFEAVAGVPPFGETHPNALFAQIMVEPAPPLRVYRSDAPPQFEALVAHCLEKDPARRVQDIAALTAALLSFAPPSSIIALRQLAQSAAIRVSQLGSSGGIAGKIATGAQSSAPLIASDQFAGPGSPISVTSPAQAPFGPAQARALAIAEAITGSGRNLPVHSGWQEQVSGDGSGVDSGGVQGTIGDNAGLARTGTRTTSKLPKLWRIIAGAAIAAGAAATALWLGVLEKSIGKTAASASASASSSPPMDLRPIHLVGSGAINDLVAKSWAKEFQAYYPGARVLIENTGTTPGIEGLLRGDVDLASASRTATASERKRGLEAGFDLWSLQSEWLVGLDAIAIVVNASNPLSEITLSQLRGVLSGKLTDWAQLRAGRGRIGLILRPEELGEHETIGVEVMGTDKFLEGAETIRSNADLSDRISRDPLAISFMSFAVVGKNKALRLGVLPRGRFVAPSTTTIRDRSYPLSRGLFIYSRGDTSGSTRLFLERIRESGQTAIEAAGFVAVRTELVDDDDGRKAVISACGLPGAKRRTFNADMHTQINRAALDNISLADMGGISRYLCSPRARQFIVELVAFGAPAKDDAGTNRLTDLVKKELLARCPQVSFGCETQINSGSGTDTDLLATLRASERIEIWVRLP